MTTPSATVVANARSNEKRAPAVRARGNPNVGTVVIGRNEGERLRRCLASVAGTTVVYVDSGSTDDSVRNAVAAGADVVALDLSSPFTAARARNAGFARLMELRPESRYVQFVDGDCEVADGWLEAAVDYLEGHEQVAIACGRRKERYPERSIYNALCDIEWDTPIGETEACGGDFLVRAEAFRACGGFTAALIAGEEPEMCYRLRRSGWSIHRIDRLMTHHDAAITRVRQWALRSSRSGYAYAARAAMHWRDRNRYCWRENARIAFWAVGLPGAIAALALGVSPWFALLALAYPAQYLRYWAAARRVSAAAGPHAYALFLLAGKWPEFYGQLLFVTRLARGTEQVIIEYK